MRRSASTSGQSRLRPAHLAATAALAVLSLAAMGRHPAHAGDNKWYPGSLCQRTEGSSDVYATDFNRIHNASALTVQSVSCPIVRDNTGNTNGSAGEAWVYAYNNSGSYTLSCTFYSSSG